MAQQRHVVVFGEERPKFLIMMPSNYWFRVELLVPSPTDRLIKNGTRVRVIRGCNGNGHKQPTTVSV
jgi:hypothetical protein